jgi:hypothetical protein
MSKIPTYPLSRADAEVYTPVFTSESWGDGFDHPLPARVQPETVRSHLTYAIQYDYGVKVSSVGEFGEKDKVNSFDLQPGTLLKSTYEALLVKKTKDACFDPADGTFSASELPLGFSVQYESKGIVMEYVQRTIGHVVLKNKREENVLVMVLPILDFTDGSLVDEEVLDTNPHTPFRMFKYPALTMGPTSTDGWQINAVHGRSETKLRREIEQKMRVARTEIFRPQRHGGRGYRRKNVKKSEALTPAWLHT